MLSNPLTFLPHRDSFQAVIRSNNMLAAAVKDSGKRPRPDDMDSPAPLQSYLDNGEQRTIPPLPLSRANYPHVKFWTRDEWRACESARRDTSEIDNGDSNQPISTTYFEMEDGTPVPRTTATRIRKTARSIWIGLSARGKAPSKWGQASREAEDEYIDGMEKKWPILRLCEDHWKVIQIATSNYPQWYFYHSDKPDQMKSEEIDLDQQKHKKAKIAVDQAHVPESADDGSPLDGAILESPVEDAPSPRPEQVAP